MKTLLLFLAASLSAFAAAPVVTIDDNLNCFVNGSDWGKAGDVMVNHRTNAELVVSVNMALAARIDKIKTDSAAAVVAANAAKKAAEDRVSAIVTALKGASPTSLPVAVRAELLTAREKERAALIAAKADAEAKLAALP